MENIIRNILFVLAIVALITYFLPGRPPIGEILENSSPLLIFLFIIGGFFTKIKKEAKKKGIKWQDAIKTELKKIEAQSRKK